MISYNEDIVEVVKCASGITEVTVPEKVTGPNGREYKVVSIGVDAFYLQTDLESVKLPASVTAIKKSAFGSCYSLKNIVMSPAMKTIGDGAFSYCHRLSDIEWSEYLEEIGDNAFHDCDSLRIVKLPPRLKRIGSKAFSYCRSLSEISIPASVTSISEACFYYTPMLTSIKVEGLNRYYRSIDGVLYDKKVTQLIACGGGVKSVDIPSSVTVIGNSAFGNCRNLKLAPLPAGLKSIEYNAFSYCDSLQCINLPRGLEYLGDWAFAGCKTLRYVNIPVGVKEIYSCTFSGCDNLEFFICHSGGLEFVDDELGKQWKYNCTLLVPKSEIDEYHRYVGNGSFKELKGYDVDFEGSPYNIISEEGRLAELIFWCSDTRYPVVPEYISTGNDNYAVSSIGEKAFFYNGDIISVKMPSSVTSIGNSAFSSCISMTSVDFSDNLTSIDRYAFLDCRSLEKIELPRKLKDLGIGAFRGCSGMVSVEIPAAVSSVNTLTFTGCESLKSVTCHAIVPPECSSMAFTIPSNDPNATPVADCELFVPSESISSYGTAPVWKDFGVIASIDLSGVESINTELPSEDSGIFDLHGRRIGSNMDSESLKALPKGIYIVNGKKIAL